MFPKRLDELIYRVDKKDAANSLYSSCPTTNVASSGRALPKVVECIILDLILSTKGLKKRKPAYDWFSYPSKSHLTTAI